ncbi:sugar kinase, ribokinase [Opitutaceae bacterium TAV1]|nr:sugar kinase, ribokinase [Opitutaceae bacterium TAV1]
MPATRKNNDAATTSAISPDLLVFGELLWDLLPSGPQPGGAPANVAVQAQGIGVDSLLVSAVGDDNLGHEMLARLRAQGVRLDGIRTDPEAPTGTVEVTLSGNGIPSYHIRRDVAWDHIVATPALGDAAASARAFCFGSLAQRSPVSHKTLRALLARVPPGCVRFFDVNLRKPHPPPEIIRTSLAHTDVLKLNHEELPLVARWLDLPADEAGFARALHRRYPVRTILLTRGPDGATVFGSDHPPVEIPASPVKKIIDTVGAGDAFSAGFLAGLLKGLPAGEAAALGSDLAAEVCQTSGAWLPAGVMRDR